MPHQIIFTSAATRTMRARDLAELMQQMRERNEEAGVTGLLLYCQGTFLQVLEGPRQTLKTLYEEIAVQNYHHGLTTIKSHEVEKRDFDEWSMGFCELTEQQISSEIENQDTPSAYSHFMDESRTVQQLRRLARRPSFAYETLMRFKGR